MIVTWASHSARPLALAAVAALALSACAAPRAATPAAPAPAVAAVAARPALPRITPTAPPAGLGTVERFAWLSVGQMADALAVGDAQGFLGRVSRGFYKGYPALESAVLEILATTESRTVVAAVDGVEVEGERVSVRARWTRSFELKDGTRDERAGETVFLFLKSDMTLRLLDYKGDPPFGVAGI